MKPLTPGAFARPDGSGRSIRDVLRVGHTLDVEVGPATPHKLALNPRMRLFGATSAWSLATNLQLEQALTQARRRWALIDARRVYAGTTAAMRSVRTLARGSRLQMQAALAVCGPVTVDEYGIHRVAGERACCAARAKERCDALILHPVVTVLTRRAVSGCGRGSRRRRAGPVSS